MDKYAQRAGAQVEELVATLAEHEIQDLRECLSGASQKQWLQWCDDHASEIRDFVRATKTERRRQERWKAAFPMLVYASYLHCAQGYVMLLAISQHDLTPGGPYRFATAQAGAALQSALDGLKGIREWPWDGKNPISRRKKAAPGSAGE